LILVNPFKCKTLFFYSFLYHHTHQFIWYGIVTHTSKALLVGPWEGERRERGKGGVGQGVRGDGREVQMARKLNRGV
jgi:putative methionine-R-sulfoxide reductase with GAF domain